MLKNEENQGTEEIDLVTPSPDLNLTPLAAFLRCVARGKKNRKKAARGVRFKSGLSNPHPPPLV